MKVITSTEDAALRSAALRRYPYLARYGGDMRMHMACCLCYPRPADRTEKKDSPVAWDRRLIYESEAV